MQQHQYEEWNAEQSAGLHRTPSTSHSSKSRIPPKIVIPPTEVSQRIYNQIREKQERRVAAQANEDLFSPVTAAAMNGSYSGDPQRSPAQESVVTKNAGAKRPRGRTYGLLDEETRLKIAFKRKVKLVCPEHRAKKTSVRALAATMLSRHFLLTFFSAITMTLVS